MKFKDRESEKKYYEQEANQEDFLEWYKEQDLPTYEKPSVTVDNIMFAYDRDSDEVKVLLIKRKANPFRNMWAIPGGFVDMSEDTFDTVIREVKEEVNLDIEKTNVEQLATFGKPNRDPRGRVISIAHLTFLPELPKAVAGDDAKEVQWFVVDKEAQGWSLVGERDNTRIVIKTDSVDSTETIIAFDHADILLEALNRISGSLDWKPKVLNILGGTFTLPEARKVYSKFMNVNSYLEIDNSNFKKTHGKLFKEVGLKTRKVGRPAKLFKLKDTY